MSDMFRSLSVLFVLLLLFIIMLVISSSKFISETFPKLLTLASFKLPGE